MVRMNLRGAGSSRPLCQRNYHAGFTTNLEAMASALGARRYGQAGLDRDFTGRKHAAQGGERKRLHRSC